MVQANPLQPDQAAVVSAEPVTAPRRHIEEKVVIRPYPKIIVYIPTMIAAVVCGVLSQVLNQDVSTTESIALAFMVVFFVNTIIVAFEFPRMTAVAVVLLVICAVLVILLLNQWMAAITFFVDLLEGLHMRANAALYYCIGAVFFSVFAISWVLTRFNYWVVMNNELLHRHGPFGDLERFPAPQLKIDKEITDIFEYMLFRSGRLVFYPTSERRAIIVESVMLVNRVENRIKQLLESLEVRIDRCSEEPA